MATELNLYETFRKILSKSKVIEGRFVVCPGYSSDINSDSFNQIFKDAMGAIKSPKKYPVALMYPPVEIVDGYEDSNFTKYKIELFFLTTIHNGSNGLQSPNFLNNTSDHTIMMTWKDMNVCAKNFRMALNRVVENTPNSPIREAQTKDVVQRYSKIGNDETAGVGITFELMLFDDCILQDYNENDLLELTISSTDIHPHHKH